MIYFEKKILSKLISICQKALPKKAFGIISGKVYKKERYFALHIYPLKINLRTKNPEIDEFFSSYGEFYRNKERCFFADSREQIKILREIEIKKENVLAIYHSHRCLSATPSIVDIDLHYGSDVYCIIVSLTKPKNPDIKAFKIKNGKYKEVKIKINKRKDYLKR